MASARHVGPLCPEHNPMNIDAGTAARTGSPRSGPAGAPQHKARWTKPKVRTLLLHRDQLLRFFTSVAQAKWMEAHTKVVFKEYKDSKVLNEIYKAFPFLTGPGTIEVETQEGGQAVAHETERLMEFFISTCSKSPARAIRFLSAQEEIRTSCLATVQQTFQEASQLNRDMEMITRQGIGRLGMIKASSTVLVKTGAFLAGGWAAFFVSAGYDITLDVIKNWEDAEKAELVGIAAEKATEKVEKKGFKDVSKALASTYKTEGANAAAQTEKVAKQLAKAEQELARRATAAAQNKVGQLGRRLLRAKVATSKAKWGRAIFTPVKYIFFAYDLYSAGKDADDTFKQAGYADSKEGLEDLFHRY